MTVYRCLVRGDDFPGVILGQDAPVGFYTTLFVEADSAEQAEAIALGQLRNDPRLQLPEGTRSPGTRVFFEEIDALPGMATPEPASGFSFFPMGTD